MWQKIEVKIPAEEGEILKKYSPIVPQKALPDFWREKLKNVKIGEVTEIGGEMDYCFIILLTERGVQIGISGSEDSLIFVPGNLQDILDYAKNMKEGIEEGDYDEEDCLLPYPTKKLER